MSVTFHSPDGVNIYAHTSDGSYEQMWTIGCIAGYGQDAHAKIASDLGVDITEVSSLDDVLEKFSDAIENESVSMRGQDVDRARVIVKNSEV